MEVQTQPYVTDLQQNPDQFAAVVAQIESIGREWVAKATGYSEQYITAYVRGRQGSVKLETTIIQNLGEAVALKHAANTQAYEKAILGAEENLQRLMRQQEGEAEELKKIANFLQEFRKTVAA